MQSSKLRIGQNLKKDLYRQIELTSLNQNSSTLYKVKDNPCKDKFPQDPQSNDHFKTLLTGKFTELHICTRQLKFSTWRKTH